MDGFNNAYVTGYTASNQSTFPVTVGPDLTHNGNSDVFVAKINAPGTALVYCGYIGGNSHDQSFGIALDGSGSAYVTGYTASSQSTFPVTKGPVLTFSGSYDAFVAKIFSSGTALVYCGYIGGSNVDISYGVAVDRSGNAYVAGSTWSDQTIIPVTVGPDLTFNGGTFDAFGAKVGAVPVLTITAGAGGTTDPAPGAYAHDIGASVSVQALPATAYMLESWTGDASGSANPLTVVMSADKSIQANFSKAMKPPINLTGQKLANRNVSMVEYVVRLRWEANPANTGTISYRVYQIEDSQVTAIADVGVGTLEHIVRKLQKTKSYRFGVKAVNSLGWESDTVEVTVQ